MKNTKINKLSRASLVLIMCYGTSFTHAATDEIISDIYSSKFDSCFSEGYNIDKLTQDQAFITAQCFTSLLEIEGADITFLGASKLTIMQYSDSWYKAAIEKGHKLAQAKLDANTIAFNTLKQQAHFGIIEQDEQLLASEKTFKTLDADKNGTLSFAEASSSQDLKAAFTEIDFDNDGKLSVGEYTIQYGEMTAAGKSN
jgi:hypothetical protein